MKHFLPIMILALMLPHPSSAASPTGLLIKNASSPAVYYAYDDKRFVFPNESVYKSWYDNFDDVVEVTDEDIAVLPLGGNVTYRPGSLIKIESDPRVYTVSQTGLIHWLTSEKVAQDIYGEDWNSLVHDVPVTSFMDYDEDEPIEEGEEMNSDVTTAIRQLAQHMKSRPAPVLTLLENATSTHEAVLRLDSATVENRGWSSIIEGRTRFDPILAICEFTWCELTIQYTTDTEFTAFTTVKGSDDLLSSNTISLSF
ncbi:MAG: hypothetical protein NUV81_00245 [bacterium]|nr:hypothetical protein [bacterium]